MLRWKTCLVLSLCTSVAVAAPRLSNEEKYVLLRRNAATQVELAKLLSQLGGQPEFLAARNGCWGGPSELPEWGLDELKTVKDALVDLEKKIALAINSCRQAERGADEGSCSDLGERVDQLSKATLRLNVMRAEFFSPREGAVSVFKTAQLEPERSKRCGDMAEALEGLPEAGAPGDTCLGAHAPQVVREWYQRNRRLRAFFIHRALVADSLATASVALGAVTSQPLGFAERLGGTDRLSVALGSGFASAYALSGTRLMVTLLDPFQGFRRSDPERVEGQGVSNTLLGLRFELPLTKTAVSGPFTDEVQRVAYQYSASVLLNLGDQTDPRREERQECFRGAEALSPALGVETHALQDLEQRRYSLYSLCERQALPDWRGGLRAGATFRANPKRLREPAEPGTSPDPQVQLGQVSLGGIIELAPWITLQVMGRRDFTDLAVEGTGALHVGGGAGGRLYGVESTVHLGVDFSAAWRNPLGGSASDEFTAMAAPSLAVKLSRDSLLAVSGGYLFGGPRAGFVASAALVWDMDRFFLQEPPPLSPL